MKLPRMVLPSPVTKIPAAKLPEMTLPSASPGPPIVLLRQDGTAIGPERRVTIQTSPRLALDVSEIICPVDAVTVTVRSTGRGRLRHRRHLDVRLTGTLPAGTHETVITLRTGIEGRETLTIPVTIEIPSP